MLKFSLLKKPQVTEYQQIRPGTTSVLIGQVRPLDLVGSTVNVSLDVQQSLLQR